MVSLVCATVANVGLAQLIDISVPVLMTVYPVAIALVAVTFLTECFAYPKTAHRLVVGVALFFGIIDGFKAAKVDVSVFNFMPLHNEGMAWLLPTAIVIIGCLLVRKPKEALAVS